MPRARRHCPGAHATCPNLIDSSQRYCPEHQPQPWHGPRTASSKTAGTRAWKQFRLTILRRDHYQCQIRTEGICIGHASVVDKIIPAARRPDLAMDPANCRAACPPCNDHKARTTDRERAAEHPPRAR